ncbi:Translation initiation factor eIF-2B subunit gamma [Knufia fluminis]|uniref:Translation initiation factor eIF2B subunit gamma n=1 Tax=Knufia fluminis TaxID=191047 RepID=A0AAN8IJZ9_9EURO|nr:Translation initiation factor eIF-2B subunit gamma [Knufia fluminis]
MIPTRPISCEYMQLNITRENKSHLRLIGYQEETERQLLKSERTFSHTNSPSSQTNLQRHQRIHSLILGARQVEDNGSISGQTFPYLPKAPSLFRDSLEDQPVQTVYRPSPLQNLALTNYSFRTATRRVTVQYSTKTGVKPLSMPHAVTGAQTGFQALILCGPGIGLNTFTNTPQEYPKALVPIANRPMIWYVLDWCYRMGVTDITIITPPAAKAPIEAALAQNPDLTTLPSPKPDLLAPQDLEPETPTAELLRLPEVQDVIKSDFLLLPCDLICDIPSDAFLESYLTSMAGIAGTGADFDGNSSRITKNRFDLGAEGSGRRGGLSIWYNTVNREESVKKEECDFMGTVAVDSHHKAPLQKVSDFPEGRLRKLVWTTPMSELLEEAEENKSWRVRQSLLRRYGAVKCMTQYRDSHIYFFPHWVKEFAMQNEDFESVSEDLVGTWAKAEWRKPSYRVEFGANKIFKQPTTSSSTSDESRNRAEAPIEEEIDLLSLSSTQITQHTPNVSQTKKQEPIHFASRVQGINPEDSIISTTTDDSADQNSEDPSLDSSIPHLPPILSYILPSTPTAPLLRRVDSTPLLLTISLLLAKLPSQAESSSPFAHQHKLHPTSQWPSDIRVSVSTADSLIASNTTLNQHCSVKQSCIGSNCVIGAGARIQGCVIMDGAQIGEKSVISGCVVGKKAVVGKGVTLKDCEVADGKDIAAGTEAKNEKFLVGGLDEDFGGGSEDGAMKGEE